MKLQICKECKEALNSKGVSGGLLSGIDIFYYCNNPKCKFYKFLRLEID